MRSLLAISTIISLCISASAFEAPSPNARRDFLASLSTATAGILLSPGPASAVEVGGKLKFGDESIMSQKAHGTSEKPVQSNLMYGVSEKLADKICNFNRQFAEFGGYFRSTSFEDAVLASKGPVTFYDSVTGKPLFVAPINRSAEDFIQESEVHGWPSFRDDGECLLICGLMKENFCLTYPMSAFRGRLGKRESIEEFWRDCLC